MEVQCLKVKLKPGTTEQFTQWLKSLYERMDLVKEALLNETMIVESMFLDRCDDADYLLFYTRATSLEKANKAMLSSKNPVDIEALQVIQKTWETANPLDLVFDADTII